MNWVFEHIDGLKIPPGWEIDQVGEDGILWRHRKHSMSVLLSGCVEQDDKRWLHLSIAHPRRLPAYDEMKYLKRHWAGADKKCIQIFAPESEHVNVHPNCLHLFCCMDEDSLPDFTRGLPLI